MSLLPYVDFVSRELHHGDQHRDYESQRHAVGDRGHACDERGGVDDPAAGCPDALALVGDRSEEADRQLTHEPRLQLEVAHRDRRVVAAVLELDLRELTYD